MGLIYCYNPNSEISEILTELEQPPDFVDPTTVQIKINAEYLNYNIAQECYRERLANFIHLAPLLKKQVELSEADYILYMHSYARVQDMGWSVKEELEEIANTRKHGAEIIVLGKACNVRDLLDHEIENVTYLEENFIKRVARKFGRKDISGTFYSFDDNYRKLSIWPVDGCKNKCAFCRRSYMHIPFQSIPLKRIKRLLDWARKEAPEWLAIISLRAENITEYGLDLYGERRFYEVLELINDYPEIKIVEFPIGLCIGELSDRDITALCNLKADVSLIVASLEVGTDRLLKLIRKSHTVERAREIIKRLRLAHPKANFDTTVMVGIPTETLADIDALADLLVDLEVDHVLVNKCGISPRSPLAQYPLLSPSLVEYHNVRLVRLLKQAGRDVRSGKRTLGGLHQSSGVNYQMRISHESFLKQAKGAWRFCRQLNAERPYDYPRKPRKYEYVSFY